MEPLAVALHAVKKAGHGVLAGLNAIYERGRVPLFALTNFNDAREIVKPCADGGARVILCRIRDAANIQVFKNPVEELAENDPLVIPGAGPAADARMAEEFLKAGRQRH